MTNEAEGTTPITRATVMSEELNPHDFDYWLNSQNIQLHAGEMSPQELRSVKAIVTAMKASNTRHAPDPSGVVEALEAFVNVWGDAPDDEVIKCTEGHRVVKARAALKDYKEKMG